MRYIGFQSRFLATIAILGFILGLGGIASAKKDKRDHPLRVLKSRVQSNQGRTSVASARGNLTVWLQNTSNVTVDGIEMEIELYNDRNRKVETLRREIEDLEAGEKKVITFRWDVIAEKSVTPKIFVEYKARGTQKARFEGRSPN